MSAAAWLAALLPGGAGRNFDGQVCRASGGSGFCYGDRLWVGRGGGGLVWRRGGAESLVALARLIGTSILLGAVFFGAGLFAVVTGQKRDGGGGGMSAGLWLIFVVLYDLGLLGAVVMDSGGTFTQKVFPWLMVANPADAFRVWNIAASESVALTSGMTGAAQALPSWAAPLSLLIWPFIGFVAARAAFRRVEHDALDPVGLCRAVASGVSGRRGQGATCADRVDRDRAELFLSDGCCRTWRPERTDPS